MDSIITFLNTTGKSFIDFSTSMLIQSSVLIIMLLLLDFLLRKRVRAVFLYCIWMLILVKLVLPTTLSSPTSLGYWFGVELPGIITQKASIPQQTAPIPQRIEPVIETIPSGTGIAALPSAGASPELAADDTSAKFTVASSPAKASLSWQGFAFLGWLAVVIAMVLLLIKRMFFVRGLLAQSKKPNDSMLDIFERCCKQMRVHRSTFLKLSPDVASPSVCGLFRPTILIPQELQRILKTKDLKPILLHELAHIKRGDLWINLIQTILQIAYFYNPLLWVANVIIRKVREQAVDEMVLVAMGEQAEDYPETLLNISRLTFSRPVLSLRLVGIVESKKALNVRIRHMLNRPIPKSARLGILGLLVVIITGVILLPMAKADKDKEVTVEDNVSNESQFIATLPNGVTVELFGICEHPSTGKQWWRPDGSILSQRPFEKLYQRWHTKREYYELALKIENPENRKLSIISKPGGVFNLYPDNIWGGWVLSEGKKMRNQSIGIAQGPWKTIMEADPMHIQSFGDIAFGKAFESDYELIGAAVGVTATHTVEKEKADYRIIAVDRKSNIHTSSGRSGIGNGLWIQRTVHFKDLQIDEIKEFQFQTRPYQWVEFKNVSLKPNFKTDVQVEVVGERETRVTMQGGEISVLKGKSGPDVVVRRKLPPEGTAYYKKFNKKYLLEIVSKSYGQNITETIGRKTSGETSGPKFVQKRIGFEIPFAYKEVDRLRKKREFQKQLYENIKKDIKDILRVTAGGGGVTDLRHLEYSTDKVVGSINIYFSQTDEDILQLKFTIHEVVTAEDKTDVQVEVQGALSANGISAEYLEGNPKVLDGKLRLMENECDLLGEKIKNYNQTIQQLGQEYGTVDLESRQEMMLQRVSNLLNTLTTVESERIALEVQIQLLERTREQAIAPEKILKMRQDYINQDPAVLSYSEDITKLEREIIVVKQTLIPTHPEIQNKTTLLETLKQHLAELKLQASKDFDEMATKEATVAGDKQLTAKRNELEQKKAYEKRLRELLSQKDSEAIRLGRKQLTIEELKSQLESTQKMYDLILRGILDMKMQQSKFVDR